VSYRVSIKGKEAEGQIEQLRKLLSQAGLSAKVIYSGGEDLDVLPEHASKGKGLEFLLKEVRLSKPEGGRTRLNIGPFASCDPDMACVA
jgi:hydroxymethylpyrimidine pyrophosphatase-like HAD family hydrolase